MVRIKEKYFDAKSHHVNDVTQELTETHKKINAIEQNKTPNDIIDSFSETFGFDVNSIVHKAEIIDKPLPFDSDFFQPPQDNQEISKELQEKIDKKLLVDLFIQGFAMNAMGGYYSFTNEHLSPEE